MKVSKILTYTLFAPALLVIHGKYYIILLRTDNIFYKVSWKDGSTQLEEYEYCANGIIMVHINQLEPTGLDSVQPSLLAINPTFRSSLDKWSWCGRHSGTQCRSRGEA